MKKLFKKKPKKKEYLVNYYEPTIVIVNNDKTSFRPKQMIGKDETWGEMTKREVANFIGKYGKESVKAIYRCEKIPFNLVVKLDYED